MFDDDQKLKMKRLWWQHHKSYILLVFVCYLRFLLTKPEILTEMYLMLILLLIVNWWVFYHQRPNTTSVTVVISSIIQLLLGHHIQLRSSGFAIILPDINMFGLLMSFQVPDDGQWWMSKDDHLVRCKVSGSCSGGGLPFMLRNASIVSFVKYMSILSITCWLFGRRLESTHLPSHDYIWQVQWVTPRR